MHELSIIELQRSKKILIFFMCPSENPLNPGKLR